MSAMWSILLTPVGNRFGLLSFTVLLYSTALIEDKITSSPSSFFYGSLHIFLKVMISFSKEC